VVLFTALIGPHFVDWTSYRETFEREATAYVGRPVTVEGKASVRLLPTPVLSFTDIHIGEAERPDVEMERFRAEVELAPLLKGEVRIIQMAVERPRFHVDIGGLAENRGVFAGEWRLDPDRISLERLQIIEGSAVIADSASGRTWQVDGVDAVIEASTLLGPAKVEASFLLDGAPVAVRAGLGRYTDLNTIALKLSIDTPRLPVTLSTTGTLHLSNDTPPSYEGIATVEGVAPEDANAPRSPWTDFRAAGAFELEPAGLTFQEMQLSYGAMERPLIVQSSGQIDFGQRAHFDIALSARQIDLDRTLAGGEQDPFAIETALAALVELLPRAAPPPLPGSLRLDAQGVVAGGSLIQAVGIDLVTAGNSWVVEDFAAMLPGETRIDLNGTLGLSAGTTFRGHARMASKRPAAFAAWWRGTAGSAGRIGAFSVEADLDLTPANQRLSGLVAATADGAIEGTVDVRSFPQSGQLFLTVDLSAERADLVETRALAELLVGKAVMAGRIDQMTLSLSADVLSAGGVEARSVVVEGGLEDGRLNFRRLSVADLAGANINANGSIKDPFGTPYGRIDASVTADDIGGAAKFLLSVLPESPAVRRMAEVAPILSPVSADISAEAGAAGERVSLELTGSFADTHVSLQAEGAGSLAEPETLTGTLRLRADGEDSAKVLRQLGFELLPVQSAPFRINADFDGALASAGKLRVEGTAAGIDLTYDSETALNDGQIALAGDFTAESANIDAALLLAGAAVPGVGEGHTASAAGRLDYAGDKLRVALSEASFDGQQVGGTLTADFSDGIKLSGALEIADASLPVLAALFAGTVPGVERNDWSDQPFTDPLPEKVSLDFSVGAARLDLGAPIAATEARLDFKASNGKLEIDLAESDFAGGTLKGSAGATMSDSEAELSIRATLEDTALQSLVWERVGLPTASGTLDLSFEAVGRGRSVAGIVATLSGSGSFSVDDGRLNSLNPDALTAVMAAAEGEVEPDDAAARETFASLFGSGALAFGRATGSLSLANGAVSVPTVSLAAGATKVLAGAMLNLNTFVLESEWTVRIDEGGQDEAQPYVPITFHGPIVRPQREIDLDPLLNLLRSRFLQRKLKELEELQRRQDEAERRAAEEEAKRLAAEEAERQAAAEAELTTGATGNAAVDPELPVPPPALPAKPAAPIDLVPEPPAAAVQPAPEPTQRRQTQAPAPAPAPLPVEPAPRYRTLPNGVVVKIR
jgi:uncharacterized protein involved in outer membrane biogenesis